MATHIDIIINRLTNAKAQADRLERSDFTTDHLRTLLKEAGSDLEIFIKTAAFPAKNQRDTFNQFIEELATVGVSVNIRDALHKLRGGYNDSKHNPAYEPRLAEVKAILKDACQALEMMRSFRFGKLHDTVKHKHRRVLWLFAWDHFIGGDTEIHICIPTGAEMQPDNLDLVYVDGLKWDELVAELKRIGNFQLGPELFPVEIYKHVAAEGDFLAAGVFEGDYRQLMSTLAKYEYRQGLLPGLNRHDSQDSMFQAVALAAVDVANRLTARASRSELASSITNEAVENYAVPNKFRKLTPMVCIFADLLVSLDVSTLQILSGPTWVQTLSEAQRASALAYNQNVGVFIDAEGTLRLIRGN